MNGMSHVRVSDLRGYSRLAIEATLGLTSLAEAMHDNISRAPHILGAPSDGPTEGITGLVYESIRGITRLVGASIDAPLALLDLELGHTGSSAEREAVLSAVNGMLGDYLADSKNALEIPMRLRHDGRSLDLTTSHLAAAFPQATGRVLLLVHGLCMNDRQWQRQEHDHGAALSSDMRFSPVYLNYNSGLHVSTNGRALARQIEALLQAWPEPVEELVILAHSMGGLVTRSACYYGKVEGHDWLGDLRKIVFLGTPHHGAPLERGGHWIDVLLGASPYSAALARLGRVRSAGITDLRYGSLVDEDWDPGDGYSTGRQARHVVPLPDNVQCYALGASLAASASAPAGQVMGDGLVPLRSALGEHANAARDLPIPESHKWIGYGMDHLDLLERREVYEQILRFLSPSLRDEPLPESTL